MRVCWSSEEVTKLARRDVSSRRGRRRRPVAPADRPVSSIRSVSDMHVCVDVCVLLCVCVCVCSECMQEKTNPKHEAMEVAHGSCPLLVAALLVAAFLVSSTRLQAERNRERAGCSGPAN